MSAPMVVYIAGPYTRPDPVVNTRAAIDAWEELFVAGYVPVCPHLSMLTHLVYPHTVEEWYAYDLALLERCDMLLRIPGDSTGADAEVMHAVRCDIPVYCSTARQFIDAKRGPQ